MGNTGLNKCVICDEMYGGYNPLSMCFKCYKINGTIQPNKQVGGTHYKELKTQLKDIVLPNEVGYYEGAVIKRMLRWDKDTGKGIEDLEKAKHEIEILIEYHTRVCEGIATVKDAVIKDLSAGKLFDK